MEDKEFDQHCKNLYDSDLAPYAVEAILREMRADIKALGTTVNDHSQHHQEVGI